MYNSFFFSKGRALRVLLIALRFAYMCSHSQIIVASINCTGSVS